MLYLDIDPKVSDSQMSHTSLVMTNPQWQRLSRDQPVTIIGDYYKLLSRFYVSKLSLKFPPPGG